MAMLHLIGTPVNPLCCAIIASSFGDKFVIFNVKKLRKLSALYIEWTG